MSRKLAAIAIASLALIGYSWFQDGAADPAPQAAPIDVDTAALLAAVPTRDESNRDTYDRDDWPHWTTDDQGCSTREAALIHDGWKVTTAAGCRITSGTWRSDYDHARHVDPGALDIDHLVPLAEAHASGGDRWTRAERERFANDPLNVRAVTASVNRAKGDRDIAEWMPTYDRCAYVAVWVVIKDQYGLSMDAAEKSAARRILAAPTCLKGRR